MTNQVPPSEQSAAAGTGMMPRTIIPCVASLLMAAVIAGCSATGPRTRSDAAQVTQLGNVYKIRIDSRGAYMLPLPVGEGWMQKWSDCSMFTLKGAGRTAAGGQQYVIGEDAIDIGQKYKSGHVILNVPRKSLTISAKLRRNYSGLQNHSGTYTNVQIATPQIVSLDDASNAGNFKGKVVRLSGLMVDDYHCQINGGPVSVNQPFTTGHKYEFVGEIAEGHGSDAYVLRVLHYERLD